MELVELVRHTLRTQLIPAAQHGGVARLRLPPEDWPGDEHPAPGPWGPEGHYHPQFELCCFLTGKWPLWVAGHLIEFAAGDVLLLPPNVRHSHPVRATRAVPVLVVQNVPTALWLGLYPFGATGQFMQTLDDVREWMAPCPLAERRVFEAAEELLRELRRHEEGYEVVAQGILLEILGRIARAPLMRGLDEPPPVAELPRTLAARGDLVAAATGYIHRHYHHDLSLEQVAAHLLVSPGHLSRQFKRATNQTLMDYLTGVRIGAAKHLLGTPLNIQAVARLVGFHDPDYFGRVFRRVTGQTPREFRGR